MASVTFSHVHVYCDSLKELAEYKKLEAKLNAFAETSRSALANHPGREGADVVAGRSSWLDLRSQHGDPVTGHREPAEWKNVRQDVVEQLMVGLGWRITGACETGTTRSYVVTSQDEAGVKFVVTAHLTASMADLADTAEVKRLRLEDEDAVDHFKVSHLARFSQHRVGREGVAVLGFTVAPGELDGLAARYRELHPKLVPEDAWREYLGAKVFEVFAYYMGEKGTSDADRGTLLRFVETTNAAAGFWVLPGVAKTPASFEHTSYPAYCDHWVSNVVSREGFLDTLQDTLGFTPKVDFNAGVVAAGEAQIESTVTGNDPSALIISDEKAALRDQSQVYLPINNALSEVGHVHLYLQEIGQGVQHIASRVVDLAAVVQRANDFREMTGAGLSFLTIPRSYYGTLTAEGLSKAAGVEFREAQGMMASLREASIVDASDIVRLDATRGEVVQALPGKAEASVVEHILGARYSNLYALLRDNLDEEAYLRIVRNNILVDVQGDDLLMQIFTSTVLQRNPGEEAPFLEFIQRVCSEKVNPATGDRRPIKPGCGGFGIRNFLTLFLSIEASKAAKARVDAEAAGQADLAAYYGQMVDAFNAQLDESNPILTALSDAMTAEGAAVERGDQAEADRYSEEKAKEQEALQKVSGKYKELMCRLRKDAPVGA